MIGTVLATTFNVKEGEINFNVTPFLDSDHICSSESFGVIGVGRSLRIVKTRMAVDHACNGTSLKGILNKVHMTDWPTGYHPN